MHVAGAHENGIRALEVGSNLVTVPRQALQAAGADVVESQYSVAHERFSQLGGPLVIATQPNLAG